VTTKEQNQDPSQKAAFSSLNDIQQALAENSYVPPPGFQRRQRIIGLKFGLKD